jgi:hypothetical protein
MKNHDRFLEMLARRRELSDSEEHLLRQHLTECEQCWRLAESFQDQAAVIKSLPALASPSSLRPRVLAAARQVPPHHRQWQRRPALLLAPLAVACLIAVLMIAQRHHSPNGTALSRVPHASSVPPGPAVKSQPPARSVGKSGRPIFKPHGSSRNHVKTSVQAGASTLAQVLRATPTNVLRQPIDTALGSVADVRSRPDLPYQGAAGKASRGNAGHLRTTPTKASATPVSSPAPQPTSAAVIRAGPPQTALKPVPPVRITTPTPQPTPAAGPPRGTPVPSPKP